MTTLLQILAATLLSSVLSIVLAGLISFKFLDRYMSKMLCISAGLLLTVAFTHLLPEAFEIHENAVSVGWALGGPVGKLTAGIFVILGHMFPLDAACERVISVLP